VSLYYLGLEFTLNDLIPQLIQISIIFHSVFFFNLVSSCVERFCLNVVLAQATAQEGWMLRCKGLFFIMIFIIFPVEHEFETVLINL
jgi:hypothetical protein